MNIVTFQTRSGGKADRVSHLPTQPFIDDPAPSNRGRLAATLCGIQRNRVYALPYAPDRRPICKRCARAQAARGPFPPLAANEAQS